VLPSISISTDFGIIQLKAELLVHLVSPHQFDNLCASATSVAADRISWHYAQFQFPVQTVHHRPSAPSHVYNGIGAHHPLQSLSCINCSAYEPIGNPLFFQFHRLLQNSEYPLRVRTSSAVGQLATRMFNR